jgi:hypothetical protein
MRENLIATYQITTTWTVPSIGTDSIGLAADASGVMVFAISS